MSEAEKSWKPLWTEETQHNGRSIWIKMEQKRKIMHVDWRRIHFSEIALYLLKVHNWKCPENDQIHIYWLKAFAPTHKHITKTSMQ
jgi:hypothetical protein